jgi:hypothetical protein
LLKNEIGTEITLDDGWTIIDGNQAIVAKFVLSKGIPLVGIENLHSRFWQHFSLELGFAKIGNDHPMIDGLTLITKDPNQGLIFSEFSVPWGMKHVVRRRTAPRLAI